jgi:hypothetical protein
MLTLDFDEYEFDIRRDVPLWALPQLAFLRRNVPGLTVKGFVNFFNGSGVVWVHIEGSGIDAGSYTADLYSQDMNAPSFPSFYSA